MNFYSLIVLPFVFGLIGFVEPCSMGINMMFLSAVHRAEPGRRIREIAVFMAVRALILAIFGLSVAFVGSKIFSFQKGFFTLLAVLYVAVGLLMIFPGSLLHKLRNVRIARLLGLDFGQGSLKRLGLIAGLTIPACAIPLLTVLLGQTLLTGKLLMGFVSLFIFGLALTVPLAIFSFFRTGTRWLAWIAERAGKLKVLGGIILVVIGIATYLSGSYWSRAFISV